LPRRAALALAAAPILPATAQTGWPTARSIEVFVGFSAGGGVDVMARAVAPFLANLLPGARFVIVNRPGAGGQLGHEAVANAGPDGFSIGAATMPGLVSIPIERQVRYRVADLTYIANVVEDPCALFVRPESPFRSLADLTAAGRARPEILTYGITGIGSDDHLTMFRFEAATGAHLTPVPFPGIGQMLPQVLSGQVDIAAMNVSEALPFVREGRLRGIGQAAATRWPGLPELPTYREQGVDVLGSASRGFVAPPGLPAEISDRLIAAFATMLADPAFLREAERLSMPLRPVLGPEYRAMALAIEAELRALWETRRWTQG
ncbi:MAG: tripartite tricarboxylate transporter substrate binding protein, partial [Roseococcus sp.]